MKLYIGSYQFVQCLKMKTGLKFNEFADKLVELKQEFKLAKGYDMTTIEELDKYIIERKTRGKRRRNLTSLKGFDI